MKWHHFFHFIFLSSSSLRACALVHVVWGFVFSFFLTPSWLFCHSITTVQLQKWGQGAPCSCVVATATVRSESASGQNVECVFLPWDCDRASAWWLRRRWSAWPRQRWRELDKVTNYCSLLYSIFHFHPLWQVFFFFYSLFEVLFHC